MEIIKNNLFQHIYEVDCFQKEFTDMTKENFAMSPPYPRYQRWLLTSLTRLDVFGKECIKLAGFEQLLGKHQPKLFSIRYEILR